MQTHKNDLSILFGVVSRRSSSAAATNCETRQACCRYLHLFLTRQWSLHCYTASPSSRDYVLWTQPALQPFACQQRRNQLRCNKSLVTKTSISNERNNCSHNRKTRGNRLWRRLLRSLPVIQHGAEAAKVQVFVHQIAQCPVRFCLSLRVFIAALKQALMLESHVQVKWFSL